MGIASRILVLFLVSNLAMQSVHSQNPSFSQFYGNPLYLNPALAGNKICPRITLNYRNQWPSIPGAYTTYSASIDSYIDFMRGGVALMVVSDQAGNGVFSNTMVSGLYSYHLNLSRSVLLNVGFQATYHQLSLDWNRLTFDDQLTGVPGPLPPSSQTPPQNLSRGFPDFSAGFIAGIDQRYYFGFAAHHLTQPSIGFYNEEADHLNMKITVHAGAIFDLEMPFRQEDFDRIPSISPNILYQQQGEFRQLNVGTQLNYYPFVVGLWFRHNFDNPDAAIILLGLQHNRLHFGYTFDYNVSRIGFAGGGAHEISLAWHLPCPEKRERIRAIKCPRF